MPVCVLDEADADTTGTRFLVVTHHRITMARVGRLFSGTMAEPGVSPLVSVDLARVAWSRQTG